MKNDWHEQIQRYLSGESSAEEAAALQQALNEDAKLRALYLDYVNLDAALATAAERTILTEKGIEKRAAFPHPRAWRSPQSWRWLAAAAAGLAVVVFSMVSRHRDSSPARPDIAASIASTRSAIARLSVEPAPSFSLRSSSTAFLLDPPNAPQ
jgi:anti-sigma factor RsiW